MASDLRDDVQEKAADKKAKAPKPAKPPKPVKKPAPKKPPDKKAAKPDKKKSDSPKKQKKPKKEKQPSTARGMFIMFVIFALLLGGAGFVVMTNQFGMGVQVGKALGLESVVDADREEILKQYESDLDVRAQEQKAAATELSDRESKVSAREKALEAAEKNLEKKNSDADAIKAQLEEKTNDITTVVKSLEGMDASAAAAILTAMADRQYMLTLYGQLKTATQTAILEAMSAKDAAALLESLR